MFNSVRTRLTLWYAGVMAVALIVFALIVYYAAARVFNERQDESLRSTAETVASAYVQELDEEQSVAKANEVVLAQMVFPNRFVEVLDNDGQVVARSSNLSRQPLSISSGALNEARQRNVSLTTLGNLRVAVVPLSPDRSRALGYALVGESLDVIHDSLRLLRRDFLGGVPLILLLASLGGYFLSRQSLLPISRMNEQTQRISAENLSSRLDIVNSGDEIGRLGTTINALLARLEASFLEQQRFTADASHELRTPIAVLRGETEVALERERSGPEYKASLNLIKDEAERLSRIVEDLFILARRPPDGPAIVSQPVRLDKVVSDCARAAEVLARRKDLKLSFEGCATKISLQGDDEMLKRMLLNLLDNAVKYTPAGGEIRVALSVPNGHARIAVTDNGIGISDADQRNIFDRFYRVDKARSRSLGGAGLGLSIVWWIVNAHGGTVSVDSQPGLGSTFAVELPIKS